MTAMLGARVSLPAKGLLRQTWRVFAHIRPSNNACRFASSASERSVPWFRNAGESALLLRFGTKIDTEVNKKVINYMAKLDKGPQLDGVKDILPTYASLLVKFDPLKVSSLEVRSWCVQATSVMSAGGYQNVDALVDEPRVVSIPVRYGCEDGPDLESAARIAGLASAHDVVRLHSGGDYRVNFLGFMGGFPYLSGLPAELAKVPRLETPRMKVPKGTVGIAGGQTGVYTIQTPGGWYCLGRTPMKLFDPAQDPPAKLRAGDSIKFVPMTEDIVEEKAVDKEEHPTAKNPWIQILSPGPLTTVQDIGRHGYSRHGVSRAGAADDLAIRMGNGLLGNDADAAGLEVTMGGLKVKALGSCAIALTGAETGAKLHRSGRDAPIDLHVNKVVLLELDDEVELGFPEDGMRTYMCVRGGVDVPAVLGSRSTDIRSEMGGYQGRRLEKGDTIGKLSTASGSSDSSHSDSSDSSVTDTVNDPLRERSSKTWQLRVLPGPGDPQTGEVPMKELQIMFDADFKVLPRADRMAVVIEQAGKVEAKSAAKKVEESRQTPYGLSGYVPPELIMGKWLNQAFLQGGQQMSEGTVSGTVQLPPDGNPVILLAEHQTTGGYKVPAVVIQADLWQVGQMRPGDAIRFVQTSEEEAVAALRQLRTFSKPR